VNSAVDADGALNANASTPRSTCLSPVVRPCLAISAWWHCLQYTY
jgi:hypothetical protein